MLKGARFYYRGRRKNLEIALLVCSNIIQISELRGKIPRSREKSRNGAFSRKSRESDSELRAFYPENSRIFAKNSEISRDRGKIGTTIFHCVGIN